MKETIKLKINKDDLIKIIDDYYMVSLGRNVQVRCEAVEELEGYGLSECYETKVKIYFIENTKLGNIEVEKTKTLEEKDLLEILNSFLKRQNLEVNYLSYRTYSKSDGIYEEKRPFFEGIDVYAKPLGQHLILGRR